MRFYCIWKDLIWLTSGKLVICAYMYETYKKYKTQWTLLKLQGFVWEDKFSSDMCIYVSGLCPIKINSDSSAME